MIVVDDGSTDGTLEIVSEYADEVIYSGRHLIGASRQIALEASDKDVLLFLDADVELVRNPQPVVGAVRGDVAVARGKNRNLIGQSCTRAHAWGVGFGLTAIDRQKALAVGGFPDRAYGEDVAMCRALRAAGNRCVQVGDRIYGVHYKSKYDRIPPRDVWPSENFDELVEALCTGSPDRIRATMGAIDSYRLPEVISEAVAYGIWAQLRERRTDVGREKGD